MLLCLLWLLLEQLSERLASIGRSARGSFALDDCSWHKQFAHVARVFVHDAYGDRFTALEAGGRIEIRALTTGVEVCIARWTSTGNVDAGWSLCST